MKKNGNKDRFAGILLFILLFPFVLIGGVIGVSIFLIDRCRWKASGSAVPYRFPVTFSNVYRMERVLKRKRIAYEYLSGSETGAEGFLLSDGQGRALILNGDSEEDWYLDAAGTLYWQEPEESSGSQEEKERNERIGEGHAGEEHIPLFTRTVEEMIGCVPEYASGADVYVCYTSGRSNDRKRVRKALEDHPKTLSLTDLESFLNDRKGATP